jgi:hypothetical protein
MAASRPVNACHAHISRTARPAHHERLPRRVKARVCVHRVVVRDVARALRRHGRRVHRLRLRPLTRDLAGGRVRDADGVVGLVVAEHQEVRVVVRREEQVAIDRVQRVAEEGARPVGEVCRVVVQGHGRRLPRA